MHPTHPSRDEGFTVMEVVVAMVIFTLFATAALGILVRTTDMARSNGQRAGATNVALQQIEAARAMAVTDIPDGRVVTTQTSGGVSYTVTQTSKYVSSGAQNSACEGSSATLAYKLVTVVVSWPDMGSVKPIRQDTLKAVGIGNDVSDANRGAVALAVVGADGTSRAGILITLSNGRTATTTEDGCLVFAGLTPGTYSATAAVTGYVGVANTRTTTVSGIGVTAGGVARATMYYDTAQTITLAFTGNQAAAVPTTLPYRVSNTYLTTETTLPACPASPISGCVTSTTPRQAVSLFPELYTVKYGACVEPDPSRASVDLRTAPATGATASVPVGTPTIIVKTATGAPIAGRTITITHITGCSETYTIPSVGGTGGAVVIPYGSWRISTPNQTPTTVPITTFGTGNANNTATITLTVTA